MIGPTPDSPQEVARAAIDAVAADIWDQGLQAGIDVGLGVTRARDAVNPYQRATLTITVGRTAEGSTGPHVRWRP